MKSALRLRRAADFARVRRYGRAQRQGSLLISYCGNRLAHNRYGLVVGGQHGVAVARNRIKRRLRAALRDLHPRLRQGFDIVIVARRGLHAQPYSEMSRILNELFLRARLLEIC